MGPVYDGALAFEYFAKAGHREISEAILRVFRPLQGRRRPRCCSHGNAGAHGTGRSLRRTGGRQATPGDKHVV